MDGAGRKLLMFMESAQQQLGGGAWLDMRAQMRALDQSANNNQSHTNLSQEKDHLHNRQWVSYHWVSIPQWLQIWSHFL